MLRRGKIHGVGINDSDYPTREYDRSSGKRVIVWECPIFVAWKGMMKRCYSAQYHKKYPTYKGCQVCDEWLSFMNFHKWAKDKIGKDPSGKRLQLDKDFKIKDNTLYSPETCIFISNTLNNFVSKDERQSSGGYKGVGEKDGKYLVWCKDPLKRYGSYVGSYKTPKDASDQFVKRKLEYLEDLKIEGYVPADLYASVLKMIEEYSGEYKETAS